MFHKNRTSRGASRSVVAALATSTLLLAACGAEEVGSDSDGDDGGGGGGGGSVITIGVLTALTGSQAVLGEEITNGATLGAELLNEAGGIGGYTFEVVPEDHAVDPSQAVSGAQKLFSSDGAHLLLSSFTGPTLAVVPLAAENETFVLNGGAIGPDLIGVDNLYSTLANGVDIYEDLTKFMVDEYAAQSVGVIYTDEAAGVEVSAAIEAEFCPELGCDVVASESAPVGTTDFAGQIERVSSADPDVILTVAYGDDIGYLVRQIRERNIDAPIGIMDWQANAAEIAGDTASEEVIAVLDAFDADTEDPEGQEYLEQYEERFGETSGRYGANYYEHVRFVIGGLVERIVERGDDPTATGALVAELRDMIEAEEGFASVYGDQIFLLPNGTVDKPTGLFRIDETGTAVRFAEL